MRSCSSRALLRRGDRDKLDLGELVLADHAAGVLAGGAGLGAKARRQAVSRIGSAASSTMDSRTRLVSGTSAVGMSQYDVCGRSRIRESSTLSFLYRPPRCF